jgi:hypothetical protein
VKRWAALWAVLFAVYAATLGIPAFLASDYGGDEPHYLLTAESIVTDGDVDLTDEYAGRDYAAFYPYPLDRHGVPTDGRLDEPHGVGFPLLIAPAYAIGGAKAAELFLAAIAALAFVLAAALARRVVPEPWATRGVLLVALSPPALAYAATVYPELTAGAMLCGAVLLAVSVREHPQRRTGLGCAVLVALLPWLGTKYLIPGLPVLALLVHWTRRRGRKVLALLEVEVLAGSLVTYVSVNDVFYGGLTPYAADVPGQTATDAAFPGGYVDRLPRLVALWLDRDYGLLRWAPVLALAGFGAVLLWRSRRDRLARALPGRGTAEAAAGLALAVCAGQILVAAFGAPTMFGFWFPGRHLVAALPCAAVLVAWGLQRAPRTGAALGAVTLLASGWLLVAFATGESGGWVHPGTEAPLGPLVRALPLYGVGSAWADAVAAGAVAGLVALGAREWRNVRH